MAEMLFSIFDAVNGFCSLKIGLINKFGFDLDMLEKHKIYVYFMQKSEGIYISHLRKGIVEQKRLATTGLLHK